MYMLYIYIYILYMCMLYIYILYIYSVYIYIYMYSINYLTAKKNLTKEGIVFTHQYYWLIQFIEKYYPKVVLEYPNDSDDSDEEQLLRELISLKYQINVLQISYKKEAGI